MPGWAIQPPPADPAPVRSVAPSKLLGEEESGFEPASLSPLAKGGQSRFRRGELIHKLLQTLPDIEESRREASALRYLENQTDLDDAQRREIAQMKYLIEDIEENGVRTTERLPEDIEAPVPATPQPDPTLAETPEERAAQ